MLEIGIPKDSEFKPKILVIGVGGGGGNAVNNMINSKSINVDFLVVNTDSQVLSKSICENRMQLGREITKGLGAGADPEVGREAAETDIKKFEEYLQGYHMCFITAGMGGGTGTGASPVIAKKAKEMGILTVAVVTKPFNFEGVKRSRVADKGINEIQKHVDTLILIPNQNLFRVITSDTTFAEAFSLADRVLSSGVKGITDLMLVPGLVNLDFADLRSVMREKGKAMMGTGWGEGKDRAIKAAEAAIHNPLLEDVSLMGARGVILNITGGTNMTLYEIDKAANKVKELAHNDAQIIVGSTFDRTLEDSICVTIVATGLNKAMEEEKESASFSTDKTTSGLWDTLLDVIGFGEIKKKRNFLHNKETTMENTCIREDDSDISKAKRIPIYFRR